MKARLKVIKIGNSSGVILPKDLLADWQVKEGDTLSLARIPGGISLRPADSEFEAQMEVAREIMERDRDALRELAGS